MKLGISKNEDLTPCLTIRAESEAESIQVKWLTDQLYARGVSFKEFARIGSTWVEGALSIDLIRK